MKINSTRMNTVLGESKSTIKERIGLVNEWRYNPCQISTKSIGHVYPSIQHSKD